MSTFNGVIEFPHSINCNYDLLGKSIITTIGSSEVKLTFPIKTDSTDDCGLYSPIITAPSQELSTDQPTNNIDWGQVYSTHLITKEIYGVAINTVVFSFDYDTDSFDNIYQDISSSIISWVKRLFNLIDLSGKYYIEKNTEITPIYFNKQCDNIYIVTFQKPPLLRANAFNTDDALCASELIDMIDKIDIKRIYKYEYQLYLSAIDRFKKGCYRHSVTDALSSCELAVTSRIIDQCCKIGIDGKAICQNKSLGDKFNFLKHIGVEFATLDPLKEIVKIRNDIFHLRKTEVRKEECANILAIVKEYLILYISDLYESPSE